MSAIAGKMKTSGKMPARVSQYQQQTNATQRSDATPMNGGLMLSKASPNPTSAVPMTSAATGGSPGLGPSSKGVNPFEYQRASSTARNPTHPKIKVMPIVVTMLRSNQCGCEKY